MSKTVTVIALLAVLAGAGWTVIKDYRPWVHTEKDNYGHGPGELGAGGVVNKMFQETAAGVRIGYPQNWEVKDIWWSDPKKPGPGAAVFNPGKSEAKVSLQVFGMQGSLADIIDARVKEREEWGWLAWGERQYISSGRTDVTILTWQVKQPGGEVRMRQEALAKKGDKLVVVEAESSLYDWRTFKGIFWEMYGSLVII